MLPARILRLAALAVALGAVALSALAEVPEAARQAIEAGLKRHLSGEKIVDILATPLDDIYQVRLEGSRFIYANGAGTHMIAGELYSFGGSELVNLSDRERASIRQQGLRKLDVNDTIVFAPKSRPRAILNVFTDVDCGYCRLFHQQVPELVEQGVEVRYLAFPRSGPDSPGHAKLVTAWCADDPQKTLTALKNDEAVEIELCKDNPVDAQYALGVEFGVRGTPSLVLMDGTMIPGYKSAEELLVLLGL
ncbi:MAG: DsbC family protein [Porticoccaceae bacterium]